MPLKNLFSHEALIYNREVWFLIQFSFLLVGVFSWVADGVGVDSFSPETWGEWACQFPAAFWGGCTAVFSAMVLSGLMRPMKRERIIVGASLQALQFTGIAYSAAFTGGQFAIALWPIVLLIPINLLVAYQGYKYESGGL